LKHQTNSKVINIKADLKSLQLNLGLMKNKIIRAALFVGTLDILAAFLLYFLQTGKNPVGILNFIASGIFGKAAFSRGNLMPMAGLFFHYVIALAFTVFFFMIFIKLNKILKNKLLIGIIYGVFIWVVMNTIIGPLSNIPKRSFDMINAILNILILITCMGIPLSFIVAKFYKNNASLTTTP
jgi:hypothetical protein